MDDFFTSLRELGILESKDGNNKGSSSSIFAEALVPLNPYRWPSFMAGSAAASDMPDLSGKLGTPFANIQVAQEYLATAQSDTQYRDRLWQLTEHTMTLNSISESAGEVGSFAAGVMSNKIADEYMNEMVETELTKNLYEELNMEIFRATAKNDQRDPNSVRGTGTIRQNVPEYMQGDICDRPKRNERPPEWGDNGGLDEEGLGSVPSPLKPNGSPDSGSSSDSIGSFGELGSEQIISPEEISNEDNNIGGIFARCFGWLGLGAGAGGDQCFDQTLMNPCQAERLQKLREEAENGFYAGCPGPCVDLTHPTYNPPLFFSDTILPPDY